MFDVVKIARKFINVRYISYNVIFKMAWLITPYPHPLQGTHSRTRYLHRGWGCPLGHWSIHLPIRPPVIKVTLRLLTHTDSYTHASRYARVLSLPTKYKTDLPLRVLSILIIQVCCVIWSHTHFLNVCTHKDYSTTFLQSNGYTS